MSISKERLEEIKNITEINYNDCPKITREQLENANAQHHLPNTSLCRSQKVSVTLHLDNDILVYLKQSGTDWQTRVNAYLRQGIASGQL